MISEHLKTRQCPGCHAIYPYQEELEQQNVAFARYGVTSPECFEALNQVMAYEYGYGQPMSMRLDAYGAQHPPHAKIQKELGINERLAAASKQSVVIHLIALYLMIEKKLELPKVSEVMARILTSGVSLEDEEFTPPTDLGRVTVQDVLKATNREEHVKLIWAWSKSVWQAWAKDHARICEIYEQYGI